MPDKVKIASELPREIHERYFALEHGQKQLACAAGLLLYFECNEDTQWAYREWAKAIAEGQATMAAPPSRLKPILAAAGKSRKRQKP